MNLLGLEHLGIQGVKKTSGIQSQDLLGRKVTMSNVLFLKEMEFVLFKIKDTI